MPDGSLWIVVGAVALLLPASLIAALLVRARVFGRGSEVAAAVVGGVLWGVLAGPGVFGRSWPDIHQQVFVGGEVQRETLQRLRRDQAIELAVLQTSGATIEAIDEQRARHGAERGPAELALSTALEGRRRAYDLLAGTLAALVVFLAVAVRLSRPMRCPGSAGRPGLVAGLGAAIVPAVVSAVALAIGCGSSAIGSLAFGACMGAGWAVPSARARLLGRAGRSPVLDVACLASAGLGWLATGATAKSLWALIGGLSTLVSGRPSGKQWGRGPTRLARALLFGLVAPGACACAAARIDPYAVGELGVFWIAAGIAIVASGDGRWTSVYAAWRIQQPGEPRRHAAQRASAYVLSGVGLAQCAAALTLHGAGVLRDIDLAAILLAGVTLECAAGLYRLLGRNGADAQRDGEALPGVPPEDRVSPS